MLLPLSAAAQLLRPRCHPSQRQKMTPEVQRIRDNRKLFKAKEDNVVLPPSVDNSTERYFPPIFNQTGSSCAHAAGIGYMLTYEMNRLLDRDASLLENRMSYLFSWNMINEGEDQGGHVEQGLQLAKSYGIMSEADYGHPSLYNFFWATGYEKYVRAMRNRVTEILSFKDSIPQIKRYLYDAGRGEHPGGVLTFGTSAEEWQINNDYQGPSATGYHALLTKLGNDGGHALTIVGYDDLVTYIDEHGIQHTGAFIVVNSWGEYSHDRGRFYLPYDFFRDPSVKEAELSSSLNAIRVTSYEPRFVLRVGLTYSQRNELRFGISSSKDREASRPSIAPYYYSIMYHMGGAYPMQGQYKLKAMDVAFDASSRVHEDAPSIEQYFLHVTRQSVNKKKGEGEVTDVELIELSTSEEGMPFNASTVTPLRSWTYHGTLPSPITTGSNVFAIPLRPRYRVSLSPMAWNVTSEYGNRATYRLRTANGRQAKFQVIPDADGKHAHIHYAVKKE